jgi:hypothetical protein
MSQTRNVSIPTDKDIIVTNFFARHPDICFSKLMVRLLLTEIEKQDPDLMKLKEIKKHDKPVYDDYLDTLKIAVESATPQKITRAQVHYILNRKFGTDDKKADKILNAVGALLREHGLDWEGGCLVPFKPYFSEKKKGRAASGGTEE